MKEKLQTYEEYVASGVPWLRKIPSHWLPQRVKDLSKTISKGTTPSTEGFSFTNTGIRFIKAENIANIKKISKEPSFFIDEEANKALSRSQLKLNDLLIVIAGATIGKVGIVDQEILPANTNQAVCFIRFKKIKNFNFLYYVFVSDYLHKYIWYSIVQSAQPNLSMGVLSGFLLFLPEFHEQKAIADYLDTKTAQIDRKIDLLTQKAQRYEELKKALINETVTRGLDKSVPMKDSGIEWIGEIPEHWSLSRVKEQGSVRGRVGWKALKADEYVDEGYIFLSTPNIKGKEIDFENVNYITYERFIESPEIILNEKDILLAKDGSTLGIVNIVTSLPSESTVNSSIAVIRFRRSTHAKYLYYQFLSESIQTKISLKKIGMGVPHLFQRDINSFALLLPPLDEQKAIADYLDTKTAHIDQIIQTINTQIEKQKELRKTLINDVVTGKIKVTPDH